MTNHMRANLCSNVVLEKQIRRNDRVKNEQVYHGVKWDIQYTVTMEG